MEETASSGELTCSSGRKDKSDQIESVTVRTPEGRLKSNPLAITPAIA